MELHSFVIPAYKQSPYLEDCIKSLLNQTVKGKVCMITSTPCDHISGLALKYDIPLYVNDGEAGLAGDWNYALSIVETRFATIAHQDDIYMADFTEKTLEALRGSDKPLISFTKYAEIRGNKRVSSNRNLRIKNFMLFPLKSKHLRKSRFVRRRILSMGSAICCPSVTLDLTNVRIPLFENNMRSNIDWQAWEQLSFCKGDFVYIPKILMEHRIHRDSTTTAIIGQSSREEEDIIMFKKFWPGWIANIIERFYIKGEKSNEL